MRQTSALNNDPCDAKALLPERPPAPQIFGQQQALPRPAVVL